MGDKDHAYDVIVVGGGTMGLGAALALARRGQRVLVLEQFTIVHDRGSHSGQTRIIRQAYAESPDYVPLVQRAEQLWLDLEVESGTRYFYRTGGLDLALPGFDQARAARRACDEHHLPFEWLDGAEVRRRWPAWALGDEWEACYSPQTGFLLIEPALRALAGAAHRLGAALHPEEPVREWSTEKGTVEVRTDLDTYYADRLVICAGAWAGDVLAGLKLPLTVLRKVVWWLDVADPALYALGSFPIFISEGPAGSIYGFPVFADNGMKVGNHAGGAPTSPDHLDRQPRPAEAEDVLSFVARNLRGAGPIIRDAEACMYTMTPDTDFIVDRHPEHPNVVVAAGFSGHGFKFAPALGELLADLAVDRKARPAPRFAIERLRSSSP